MKNLNARARAAQILVVLMEKHLNLDDILNNHFIENSTDRGFVQELCYGTMRFYHRLEWLSHRLLKKAFKVKDKDLEALILIGLYQLFYLDTPAYAAISDTVEASRQLGKTWAVNLVNAVLRNADRTREALLSVIKTNPVAETSHPLWLLQKIQQAYPEDWQSIIEANNQKAPLTLRVNLQKTTREQYVKKLIEQGIESIPGFLCGTALYLKQAVSIENLSGFAEGEISVQDEAAQLAAGLLDLKPGQRVLDACAAPGSKTIHILETCPDGDLTAIELSEKRSVKIQENLKRMGFTATVVVQDFRKIEAWWDGQLFDRILLDAPCSATGVIRRHPDIKFLRTEKEVNQIVKLQAELLETAWQLLKPAGILLYATCSILPEENQEQIQAFLKSHPDATLNLEKILLPTIGQHDGFYYARLKK
jgi:16S rRNA (cytosine967-C5)-methyltransferase